MNKHLKALSIALGLSLMGASAFAQSAPWKRDRPATMTAAHEALADSAIAVLRRVDPTNNGVNVSGGIANADWAWARGRNRLQPVSNISSQEYLRILQGRYQIQRAVNGKSWDVAYFGANGIVHVCQTTSGDGRRYQERTWNYLVRPSPIGLAGHFTQRGTQLRAGAEFGWPAIGDPATGDFVTYGYWNTEWRPIDGFIQEEYAAIFAEKCPGLPRVSRVNEAQTATDYDTFAAQVRKFRGFQVAFQNDPYSPLTAEMLYWRHPPR